MTENIERAKELYLKNWCDLDHMTKKEREEFDSYHISDETLIIWKDEHVDEYIDRIKTYYDTKEVNWRFILCLLIAFDDYSHTPRNIEKMIDVMEFMLEKKIWGEPTSYYINESNSYDDGIGTFEYWERATRIMRLFIMFDQEKKYTGITYLNDGDYQGLIPWLYYNNYLDLFTRICNVYIGVIKYYGVNFKRILKDFIKFVKMVDNDLYLKAMSALKYNMETYKDMEIFKEDKILLSWNEKHIEHWKNLANYDNFNIDEL